MRWWPGFKGHGRRVADASSSYWPVLVMALLALGSYGIVRQSGGTWLAPTPTVTRHEVDYFMRDFEVRTLDPHSGALRHRLQGQEARHYADDDSLEVQQAQLESRRADGSHLQARSQHLRTDATQKHHWLSGEVRVEKQAAPPANGVAGPTLKFAGEALYVDQEREIISSDQAVTVQHGRHTIRAERMRYDDAKQVVEFEGRVRAELWPKR